MTQNKDDKDKNNCLEWLGAIIEEIQTYCFAWALIPIHFHLLIETRATPIYTVMRQLFTGRDLPQNREGYHEVTPI